MTVEELQKRSKVFACRFVPRCASLSNKKISKIIAYQLLQPAIPAAAKDEALFGLKKLSKLRLVNREKLALFLKEADELSRILAATGIKPKREQPHNLKYSILNIKSL